jgi:tRNA 2-thiouridine synthesizing protein A
VFSKSVYGFAFEHAMKQRDRAFVSEAANGSREEMRQNKEPHPAPNARREIALDLRGLKCPLPVLRARKAMRALQPGDVVTLSCTDPMSGVDIPHFARSEGHKLLAQTREDDVLAFTIERGETRQA